MTDSDPEVQVLRALGHPLRFAIVRLLADPSRQDGDPCGLCGIVCATRLRLRFGVSPPDLTHHMNQLEGAGLVDVHRDGVWVCYELRRQTVAHLCSSLALIAAPSTDETDPRGRESPIRPDRP